MLSKGMTTRGHPTNRTNLGSALSMIGAQLTPTHLFNRVLLPPALPSRLNPQPGPLPDLYYNTGIAPSRRNPLPKKTTVFFGIDMRLPSRTAVVPFGMSLRMSPNLASAVPIGIQLKQKPPSDPPPSSTAVPFGIQLKQLTTPVVLPILDSQQTIPPNTHETSAHCFQPKRTAAKIQITRDDRPGILWTRI